ncbi:MAG: ABC transporter ATP-binding protein [Alkaliphilus sp.]
MINAENLSISYDKKDVVNNFTMDIQEGEIVSIIGPNGSGKSTLLKVISRLMNSSKGVAYLDGCDVHRLPTKEVAKKLAILCQHNHSPSDCTVRDLVSYGRIPYKKWYEFNNYEDDSIVDWAINVTGLTEFEHRYVATLSGGERQRAWVAMALAQKTKVLILDEPTTYLDVSHQLEVMEVLKKINEEYNITIIMVLHDLNQASRYSNRMYVINQGELVMKGHPREVITKKMLRDVYKIDAHISVDHTSGKPLFFPLGLIKSNSEKTRNKLEKIRAVK